MFLLPPPCYVPPMVISGYSTANQPVVNGATNPGFSYAQKVSGGTTQDVVFQPDVILVPVPAMTKDGVTVSFPPISVTPPPIIRQVTVPGPGGVVNPYECVGQIMTTPIRLCALIGPALIALANHYTPYQGATVNFYGATGMVTGVLDSPVLTLGDLAIWRLMSRMDGITPAKLTADPAQIWYAGQKIVSFGLVGDRNNQPYNWVPAATTGKILRAIRGTGGVLTCTTMLDNNSMAEFGDSGSPNFFLWNGAPYYLGSNRKMGAINEVNMVHPWLAQISNL
jgi:hypothetical protein